MSDYITPGGKYMEEATGIAGENVISDGAPVGTSNPLPVSVISGGTGGTSGGTQRCVECVVTFNRPANTTQYTAGDAVYTSTTGSTAQTFPFTYMDNGLAVPNGSRIMVVNASLYNTQNNAP